MNPKVKLAAYVLLLILAAWFGLAFRYNYAAATSEADPESADSPSAVVAPPDGTNTEAAPSPSTNALTNLTAQPTNASGDATNAAGEVTNTAAEGTNTSAALTNANASGSGSGGHAAKSHRKKRVPGDSSSAKGAMVGYLGGFIVAVLALGLLVASDVTQFFGSQATDYLFLDVGDDAMRNPLYERAEAEWANGEYLEAIQTLRDYLKKNPREVHAALRIAEIYEKDIKNPLAAALEYEEVLKIKLPADRWGWAAIHLCNLYSKLNHHDKTRDLLQRIVNEYPKTGAAKKARVRLGIAALEEESGLEESPEAAQEIPAPPGHQAENEPEEPPAPDDSKPNLPPGFRPRK